MTKAAPPRRDSSHLRSSLYTLFSTFSFFFNDTATTEIYTLSLHDALPIFHPAAPRPRAPRALVRRCVSPRRSRRRRHRRSEEHTSELQSRRDLVCRLLLEKKKKKKKYIMRRIVMTRLSPEL